MRRSRGWSRTLTARCGAYMKGAERQNGNRMTDNKNTIIAIVLSALVLLAWQYFVGVPQQKAREEQLQAQQAQKPAQPAQNAQTPQAQPAPLNLPGRPPKPPATMAASRGDALKASQR